MARYRKKPVVIEAFRMGIDPHPDWFCDLVSSNDIITRYVSDDDDSEDEGSPFDFRKTYCEIKTLEGTMTGNYGDFIIRGVKGEVYPCKPDIFVATYELVENTEPTPPASIGGVEAIFAQEFKAAGYTFVNADRLAALEEVVRLAQWHAKEGLLPSPHGPLAMALEKLKRMEASE